MTLNRPWLPLILGLLATPLAPLATLAAPSSLPPSIAVGMLPDWPPTQIFFPLPLDRYPTPGILAQVLTAQVLTAQSPTSESLEESRAAILAAILAETNRVRTDPQGYIATLQDWRSRFEADGMTVRLPNGTRLATFEGVSAVEEAIEALQDLAAVPPLTGSEALSLAAQDHVQAQGPTGATGHEGARGGMQERIERHGDWQVTIGENISYGAESGVEVVRQLLIDDGVPGRGHRLNLLNPKFRVMGVDCGPHLNYGVMCVMTYAGGYQGAEAGGEGESGAGAMATVGGTAGETSAAIGSPDGTAPIPSATPIAASVPDSTTHPFVVQHRGTLPLVSLKLNDVELLPEALPAGETLSLALESCQGDLLLEIDGYATLPWRNLDLCRFRTLIIDSNNSMRLGLKL